MYMYMTMVKYHKMVDLVGQVGEPCILHTHTHLCIVQYLSIITLRSVVLQVCYSPSLSLYIILLV